VAVEKLIEQALSAVRAWQNRRKMLDEFLSDERLGSPQDEPGTAGLNMIMWDFEDLAKSHLFEMRHLRSQVDSRKNLLIGHARIRLGLQIRAVTGKYQDRLTLAVLNDLLQTDGKDLIAAAAFRAQRSRWFDRLNGTDKQKRGRAPRQPR